MSLTRFSEAIGYVPDLNGCRKKIIEHCRDWESAVYRLEQENKQLIETGRKANKDLRNDVNRLEQESADLREALQGSVNLLSHTESYCEGLLCDYSDHELVELGKKLDQHRDSIKELLNK